MICLLWAGLIFLDIAAENASLDQVTGTVIDYEHIIDDFYFNDQPMHSEYDLPIVSYKYRGLWYTDTAYEAKGMDIYDVQKMKIGDTAVFYTRPHLQYLVAPKDYSDSYLFAGIAAFLILINCMGFRGYKERVLRRYPKLCVATGIAAVLLPVFVYVQNYQISSNQYGGLMPGLSALGDYVRMWGLVILTQFVLLVIWVVMLIRTALKNKKVPPFKEDALIQ